MKTLEFILTIGVRKLTLVMVSLFMVQLSLNAQEINKSDALDTTGSFTMRVCGTLERGDGQEGKPTFFVQSEASDIKYAMKGDVTESHFYLEGRFLPDSTHCHLKSIKTPDAIPLGEQHCWYTVYDDEKKQMVLYMDSEDNCGESGAICEVDRISTQMDMKCGMMAQSILDGDRAKAEKGLQAGETSVAGSLVKIADGVLTQQEIQSDFDKINGK